jgi:hypothetical protein
VSPVEEEWAYTGKRLSKFGARDDPQSVCRDSEGPPAAASPDGFVAPTCGGFERDAIVAVSITRLGQNYPRASGAIAISYTLV